MPRRQKDDETVTDTATTNEVAPDAAVAGGSTEATANGEATPKRSQLDDLPLGPTTTRTGAAATVIQGPKGKRVFTAGGDKGSKIKELLTNRKDLSRKQISELVGCSQSRVAEVARVMGLAAARPVSSTEPTPGEETPEPAPPAEPEPAKPESVST